MGFKVTLLLAALLHVAASTARFTWNGCKCKEDWEVPTEGGGASPGRCTGGCCNPDEDPIGEWCMVEDMSCEDVDWGYCRDVELGWNMSCVDSPGWVDSEGDGCKTYVDELLCSPGGGYGLGWDAEWGTFFHYEHNGKTAVEACCGCGGGLMAQGLAPEEMCTNTPGWKDSDGDDCEAYKTRAYCNATGYGVGWHTEWGDFKDFATDGKSAFQACCVCGGGERADPTLNARTTWNSCACKKGWTDEAGMKCDGYCCNTDNDPNGDWCMVEDEACEEFDWGYCRPLGALVPVGSQCADDPPGWADAEGDTCDDYNDEQYCTDFGGYGPGWKLEWGNFHTFMNQQRTASTACCTCGGGHVVWQPTLAQACEDMETWKDKDGDNCASYKSMAWCTEFGAGVGWHEEWGALEDFANSDGLSALDACCHCGGGSRTRSFTQTLEVGRQRAEQVVQEKPWVLPAGGVTFLAIVAGCCLCCCCIFRKHSPEEVADKAKEVAEKVADKVASQKVGNRYNTVNEDL